MKIKLSPETRQALFDGGWHLFSAHQIPQRDGRKLDRCCEPSDPWTVTLQDTDSPLTASRTLNAQGATVDQAVLTALPTPLEDAIDRLIGVLRGLS